VSDRAIAGGGPVPDGRPAVLRPVAAACLDLLELLAGVTGGRPGQGRDHPVAAVLALAAAAAAAGSRSFTAIAGRAADVPADVLADLYRRCGAARPAAGPPSKATIWRVVTGADAAALDAVTGAWLMERARAGGDLAGAGQGGDDDAPLIPVRADGKTVRGARNADGSQVHLLAALAGRRGVVAGQVEAGAKTNEIPMIIPLPDGLDPDQAVITADALHCQRATAGYLHGRGAGFVLPAKDSQPGLSDFLDTLALARHRPGRQPPVRHRRARRHQPGRDPRQPRAIASLVRGQRARVPALAPRHPLPRGQFSHPRQIRATGHGRAQEPRNRRPAPGRTARHHRSHPLGQPLHQPALHHPRTHIMILKRPWRAWFPAS